MHLATTELLLPQYDAREQAPALISSPSGSAIPTGSPPGAQTRAPRQARVLSHTPAHTHTQSLSHTLTDSLIGNPAVQAWSGVEPAPVSPQPPRLRTRPLPEFTQEPPRHAVLRPLPVRHITLPPPPELEPEPPRGDDLHNRYEVFMANANGKPLTDQQKQLYTQDYERATRGQSLPLPSLNGSASPPPYDAHTREQTQAEVEAELRAEALKVRAEAQAQIQLQDRTRMQALGQSPPTLPSSPCATPTTDTVCSLIERSKAYSNLSNGRLTEKDLQIQAQLNARASVYERVRKQGYTEAQAQAQALQADALAPPRTTNTNASNFQERHQVYLAIMNGIELTGRQKYILNHEAGRIVEDVRADAQAQAKGLKKTIQMPIEPKPPGSIPPDGALALAQAPGSIQPFKDFDVLSNYNYATNDGAGLNSAQSSQQNGQRQPPLPQRQPVPVQYAPSGQYVPGPGPGPGQQGQVQYAQQGQQGQVQYAQQGQPGQGQYAQQGQQSVQQSVQQPVQQQGQQQSGQVQPVPRQQQPVPRPRPGPRPRQVQLTDEQTFFTRKKTGIINNIEERINFYKKQIKLLDKINCSEITEESKDRTKITLKGKSKDKIGYIENRDIILKGGITENTI